MCLEAVVFCGSEGDRCVDLEHRPQLRVIDFNVANLHARNPRACLPKQLCKGGICLQLPPRQVIVEGRVAGGFAPGDVEREGRLILP